MNQNETKENPTFSQDIVQAVEWRGDHVVLLEQTRLPAIESYLDCYDLATLIDAIKRLAVRGAPAIGVAGAYGTALSIIEVLRMKESLRAEALWRKLEDLESARPTAVNLRWAVSRMRELVLSQGKQITESTLALVLAGAKTLHDEDISGNRKMAKFGSEKLGHGAIVTVCNTGDLATGGVGTAFGVLHESFRTGKTTRVYACETRPVLQGMRLTAWELHRKGIPFTLICDNMAAVIMKKEKVAAVIVGADRIAANGDTANKIGTYSLAVLAQAHQIPFYVAAPVSTFDLSLQTGDEIPIEERNSEEVVSILGTNRPPFDIPVFNPSFDVTPHHLITGIFCDLGVVDHPNPANVKNFFAKHGVQTNAF